MSLPLCLTGTKESSIKSLQSRWEDFSQSIQSFQGIQSELGELITQHTEPADIPALEDRIQALLPKLNEAAKTLKNHAHRVQEKTDKEHIRKFFKKRQGAWYNPVSYRIDGPFEVHTNIGKSNGPVRIERKKYTWIDRQHKKPLHSSFYTWYWNNTYRKG